LDLFFENAHCFFKIIILNSNRNSLQSDFAPFVPFPSDRHPVEWLIAYIS
jgi:hypothetical protein